VEKNLRESAECPGFNCDLRELRTDLLRAFILSEYSNAISVFMLRTRVRLVVERGTGSPYTGLKSLSPRACFLDVERRDLELGRMHRGAPRPERC